MYVLKAEALIDSSSSSVSRKEGRKEGRKKGRKEKGRKERILDQSALEVIRVYFS